MQNTAATRAKSATEIFADYINGVSESPRICKDRRDGI